MTIRTIVAVAVGLLAAACAAETAPSKSDDKATQDSLTTKPASGDDDLPSCCGGRATCVPNSLTGDFQKDLASCDAKNKCVPNEFLKNQDYKGAACKAKLKVGSAGMEYEGVCLSDCLAFDGKEFLGSDGCKSGEICAPCTDPRTEEPTNAPGCANAQ